MEFDNDGERAAGALAYFFVANTTTPLTVFQDAPLTTPHTHPLPADGIGRWPEVFIPYSNTLPYKELITTAGGDELWASDNLDRRDPVQAA